MDKRRGVPVRQRRVSAELRAWRKKAGLTCADVAKALGTSITKISRMETGVRGLYVDDVAAMLGLCQVPARERQELLDLVRSCGDPNWWQMQVEGWFGLNDLIGIESEATDIANYEAMLVPGLLQTAEYATALIRGLDDNLPEQEVTRLVAARLGRQASLTKHNALRLHAIVDEMVLRRPIGEPGVMRRQLEHLLTSASQPNIKIQIVPVAVGASPALKGPLMIIDLDDTTSVVHIEAHGGGFLTDETFVQGIRLFWQRLQAVALSAERSAALITAIAAMPRRA